jgi:AcrR family transcriptional regulator
MKSENKKHGQIIMAARALFWKHGMKRVSVEEICIEAGVSKMTFYKNFANKTALALNILQKYYNESMTEYRKIMDSELSYPEKIEQAIALKLKNAENLSQEFVNELYKNGEPEIMEFMHHMVTVSLDTFMSDFKAFQERGEIRRNVKPEFMLYMLNKMTDMTTDDNFIRIFNDPADMISAISNFYFYGIMPLEGMGIIK